MYIGIPVLFLEISFERTTCHADRRCKGDVQWIKHLPPNLIIKFKSGKGGDYQKTKEQVVQLVSMGPGDKGTLPVPSRKKQDREGWPKISSNHTG